MTFVFIAIFLSFTMAVLSGMSSFLAWKRVKKLSGVSIENKQLRGAIVELVGDDGELKRSLPVINEGPTVNRTPCGQLCRWAYWSDGQENWRCAAYQGYHCDKAREKFLDSDSQCVMFEFDTHPFDKRITERPEKPKKKQGVVEGVVEKELENSLKRFSAKMKARDR